MCRVSSFLLPGLQFVKLKAFSKFDNTTEALAAATALVESKLSKGAQQP
jgi:nucleolar protein 58